MNKRAVCLILAVLTALTLTIPTFAEGVEVSFWTLSTRQGAVNPIVEEFNAANPDIKVTASFFDVDGLKDALKVAASSDTLPNMWFNWGGSLGGFYADNGLTYDLNEYAAEHKWSEFFNSNALSLSTYNGKLAGYPTSYNALSVYYRKDIFENLGLAAPTTFEEFEAVCAKLKENGITPISTAGLYGWHVMRFVELLIEHYAGAELHDQMNRFEVGYDNEAVVQALTKYKEFVEKDYFPIGFITASPNDTQFAIYTGAAAMDIQGPWYDGFIINDEQDMANYGVFAFPSGGTNRLSAFVEMTEFSAKNTPEELEASVKFMDFMHTPENIEKYSQFIKPLPTINLVVPEDQPNAAELFRLGEENGTFTITDQAFPTEVADALFNVQAAIANSEMTPEEGAKKIQEAIEAYLSK